MHQAQSVPVVRSSGLQPPDPASAVSVVVTETRYPSAVADVHVDLLWFSNDAIRASRNPFHLRASAHGRGVGSLHLTTCSRQSLATDQSHTDSIQCRDGAPRDRACALWSHDNQHSVHVEADPVFPASVVGRTDATGTLAQNSPVADRACACGWWDWRTPFLNDAFMKRWFAWPQISMIAPVPLLVALAGFVLARGLAERNELRPFLASLALFVLCSVGLLISFYPYLVPTAVTIREAAAPDASLSFMLKRGSIPCAAVGLAIALPQAVEIADAFARREVADDDEIGQCGGHLHGGDRLGHERRATNQKVGSSTTTRTRGWTLPTQITVSAA